MQQLGWGAVLEIAGKFNNFSIKTLKSWKVISFKDKTEAKYFSKFRKCQKPVVIGKEGVLAFKRLTVLKFFRAAIKGTFKALLTLGKTA